MRTHGFHALFLLLAFRCCFLPPPKYTGMQGGKRGFLPLLRRAKCNNIPPLHHGGESMKFYTFDELTYPAVPPEFGPEMRFTNRFCDPQAVYKTYHEHLDE